MSLEIKMEVGHGGYPRKTTEEYEVSLTLDNEYRVVILKTINGSVGHEIASIETKQEGGEWNVLPQESPLYGFVSNTVLNQLKKSGIAPPNKKDANA